MTTKIEWTDETWNPVHGCTPISPGCKNCYAQVMARRLSGRYGYPPSPADFDVTQREDRLRDPLKWKKPRKVFVCSMGDLFHNEVEQSFIGAVFDVMMDTPHITYQILTKRPGNMLNFIMDFWLASNYGKTLPNVWLGVTAENQEQADKRIPILLQTPAAVRFVSVEPMLAEVDLTRYAFDCFQDEPLDWVICGAETGHGRRSMQLDWARGLRHTCQSVGIPFFFKKDIHGRHTLDGRVWEEFPR